MLGRKNSFPSALLGFWLRPPRDKTQLDRRKTNRNLITCILPIYIQDTKENSLVTPPTGPGYQLKYHLQLKTKEDIEGWDVSYEKLAGKAQLTGVMLLCRFTSRPSP